MSDLLANFSEEHREQDGAQRAGFGEALIGRLATDMTERLGRGFSSTNLKQTLTFYVVWPFEQIRQTLTDEWPVTKPDIVCFVKGLPWVVIEAKRPDSSINGKPTVAQGISQNIRNQKADEIPHLFAYSQLLLSINGLAMSPPDTREGHDNINTESKDLVQNWWKANVGTQDEKLN